MKRNPIYSPNTKSEKRGLRVVNMQTGTFEYMYENKSVETKQEKFNRIFQVEDAKIIT